MHHFEKGSDDGLRGYIEEALESLLTDEYGSPAWVKAYRKIDSASNKKTPPHDLLKNCEEVLAITPKPDPSRILGVQTGLVDLVAPLSNYCESIASSLPIKFRIESELLRDDEIFAPDCTLPIFLFLAKELSPKVTGLRLFHYYDEEAVLRVRPLVPAAPDSNLFDIWKLRMYRLISSLGEIGNGDCVDLDQDYTEWLRFVNSGKYFPGWCSLIDFIHEESLVSRDR